MTKPAASPPTKRRRRLVVIAVVAAVLLASPWIIGPAWFVGAEIYSKIDQWRYAPTEVFREHEWKQPNKKYRYAVLHHVATKVVVVGMPRDAVERLLGKPDFVTEKNEWQYETKRPGWYLIDFSGGGLLVEFDAPGTVTRVSKNLWVD